MLIAYTAHMTDDMYWCCHNEYCMFGRWFRTLVFMHSWVESKYTSEFFVVSSSAIVDRLSILFNWRMRGKIFISLIAKNPTTGLEVEKRSAVWELALLLPFVLSISPSFLCHIPSSLCITPLFPRSFPKSSCEVWGATDTFFGRIYHANAVAPDPSQGMLWAPLAGFVGQSPGCKPHLHVIFSPRTCLVTSLRSILCCRQCDVETVGVSVVYQVLCNYLGKVAANQVPVSHTCPYHPTSITDDCGSVAVWKSVSIW